MLLDGSVKVYKVDNNANEIVLKRFVPFSFIAELANYTNINFPASAKSIDSSTVLVIDYKEYKKYFLYHPSIVPNVIKALTTKILSLEKVISENMTMNATQRVAKFIYEKESIFQNKKKHEVATILNITPVTLSRILKKFKEKKIMDKNNSLIDKNLLKKEFS